MSKKCENPECNNEVTNPDQIKSSHEEWGRVLCFDCQIKMNEGNLTLSDMPETVKDEPEVDEKIIKKIQEVAFEMSTDEPETVIPEELTNEQRLKIAELVGESDYDKETATAMVTGKQVQVEEIPEEVKAVTTTETKKARAMPTGYIPKLSISDVKMYLCPLATDQEAYVFLELCKARQLNPFTNEVYLIKYSANGKASTVVGKETFTRRAEQNPMFDGFEAGIIVQNKDTGDIDKREGTFYLPDIEKVVGGWAKIHRRDKAYPFVSEVPLHEYIQRTKDGSVNKMWATKEGTLIRKVPLVQGLREAFPSEFGGLYDRSEIDVGED